MFLRHFILWPSFDIHEKFYGDRFKYSDFGLIKGYILETVVTINH